MLKVEAKKIQVNGNYDSSIGGNDKRIKGKIFLQTFLNVKLVEKRK